MLAFLRYGHLYRYLNLFTHKHQKFISHPLRSRYNPSNKYLSTCALKFHRKSDFEHSKPDVIEKYASDIGDVLGVNKNRIISILRTRSVLSENDLHRLKKAVSFLRSVDIPLENEQTLYYLLLGHRFRFLLEQHYYCLKEMGFTNITVEMLLFRFDALMQKTVSMLHASGELPVDVHALISLMSIIDGPPNIQDIINKDYARLREEGSLSSMHHVILLEYLSWRFQCTHQEILNLFSKYTAFRYSSITSIMQMYQLLTKNIGFSIRKIKSNGFLLCLHADEISCMLEQLPMLGNIKFTSMVKKFPRILSIEINHLQKIEKLFEQHNITAEQIIRNGNIFTLCPNTVSKRLDFLEKNPEFHHLKSHPRYLQLVYSQKKAVERMELLQNKQKPFTINILCKSEGCFQNYLSSPEERLLRKQIIAYLSSYLNVNKLIVHKKLNSCYIDSHINSLDSIKKRIKFLEDNNFSKSDIMNNIPVLLFRKQMLHRHLDTFHNSSDTTDKLVCDTSSDLSTSEMQSLLNVMQSKKKYGRHSLKSQMNKKEFLLAY